MGRLLELAGESIIGNAGNYIISPKLIHYREEIYPF